MAKNECDLNLMWSQMYVVGLNWTWYQIKKSHVNVVSNEQVSNELASIGVEPLLSYVQSYWRANVHTGFLSKRNAEKQFGEY